MDLGKRQRLNIDTVNFSVNSDATKGRIEGVGSAEIIETEWHQSFETESWCVVIE